MSTTEVLIWVLVVLVGLGGSALCSGLEVGLYSVNRVLIRVRAAGGTGSVGAKLLQPMLDQPVPTLTALLVWNNIFNYAGTLALTTLVATLGLSDTEMILMQIVALTPLLLIFAESAPKEVFRSNADVLMERFAPLMVLLRRIVSIIPIVPLITLVAKLAAKVFGTGAMGSLGDARERIAELLKFGSGRMSDEQVTLIDRALQLEHTRVRNEMVPIRRVRAVRSGWSIERARAFVAAHPYSRYPALGARGEVVGVLHAIDLYIHPSSADASEGISGLLHEPSVVGADDSVDTAMRAMCRSGTHLAVVRLNRRDVGIVTRKDLVEPLIGELEEW